MRRKFINKTERANQMVTLTKIPARRNVFAKIKGLVCKETILIVLAASVLLMTSGAATAAEKTTPEKVEIIRDTYGIPHIFADSNDAVYYGAGWAYAQSYAPMLIYEVLTALGRSSEFTDTGANESSKSVITNDISSLALGYYDIAENWTKLPEPVRNTLIAYSKGFNDYIAAAKKSGELETRFGEGDPELYKLIMDFGEITPRQLVAYAIMLNTMESLGNMSVEALGFYVSALRRFSGPRGSNGAAISEYKTTSGNAILYGDPHNGWFGFIPTMHLNSSTININSVYSGPFASDGVFNGYAVASPRTKPDSADIYEEIINPKNPLKYLYSNKWVDIKVKTVTIKNSNNSKIEKKLYYTHHGWIFDYPEDGKPEQSVHSLRISVCDATIDEMTPLKFITQRFFQSWSKNIYEFYFISKTPYSSNHSNVLADTMGNIAYLWHGRIPVRNNQLSGSNEIDYSQALVGNDPMTDWSPKVWRLGDPEFSLPFIFNPRGGSVRAANDAPWYASGCDDEPEQRYSWATRELAPEGQESTSRGKRLKEILCSKNYFSLEYLMNNLAFDTLSRDSRDFMSSIQKGWSTNSKEISNMIVSQNALQLHSILTKWNFHADADQPGMTAMFHLKRMSPLPWFDGEYTPSMLEMKIYIESLEGAAAEMNRLYGKLEVPWGDIHYMSVQGKNIPLPGGTKNIPTLMQAYMIANSPSPYGIEKNSDKMYGDSTGETNTKLFGNIICNFGSSNIHLHVMAPNNIETYYSASQGPILPAYFPKSKHIPQFPELLSRKKMIKMPSTREEVMKELCPWGKDPKHEHKDITVIYYSPEKETK